MVRLGTSGSTARDAVWLTTAMTSPILASALPEVDPGTEFERFFEVEFERVFGAAYLATGFAA